jgi:hypothetical protein
LTRPPPRPRLVRGGVDWPRVEAALARLDAALAEHGPPRRAPTVAELAEALGADPAELAEALDLPADAPRDPEGGA